jgi:hypothetical protein
MWRFFFYFKIKTYIFKKYLIFVSYFYTNYSKSFILSKKIMQKINKLSFQAFWLLMMMFSVSACKKDEPATPATVTTPIAYTKCKITGFNITEAPNTMDSVYIAIGDNASGTVLGRSTRIAPLGQVQNYTGTLNVPLITDLTKTTDVIFEYYNPFINGNDNIGIKLINYRPVAALSNTTPVTTQITVNNVGWKMKLTAQWTQ